MAQRTAIGLVFCLLLPQIVASCRNGRVELPSTKLQIGQLRPRINKVLSEAINSPDPELRCHGLESLAQMGGLQGPALIRKRLYDPIPAVRFAAAVAAGDVRDHAARNLLERLLKDKNVSVQLAAGYALEKLGDRRFANWYDKVLQGDDAKLCGQACMLLGKLGPARTDSREKLWQVMQKVDQSPMVRLQAAEALARLGDDRIGQKLLVFANSGYADDRILAISGLEAVGGPQAYSMLCVLADDPQIEVRLAAVRALADRAENGDLLLARKAMHYTDSQGDTKATTRVRGLAALALGRIGKEKDAAVLFAAMGQENQYLRIAAARAAIDYLKRHGL